MIPVPDYVQNSGEFGTISRRKIERMACDFYAGKIPVLMNDIDLSLRAYRWLFGLILDTPPPDGRTLVILQLPEYTGYSVKNVLDIFAMTRTAEANFRCALRVPRLGDDLSRLLQEN